MNEWTEQVFTWPKGYTSDAVHAKLRYSKLDVGWLVSDVPAAAAGVYTTNQFCAAPTASMKRLIQTNHQLQALVMNSAFANACTGEQGIKDVLQEQQWVAEKLAIDPSLVGVASTGLIGAYLPMEKMAKGIAALKKTTNILLTEAILTTDTKTKTLCLTATIAGKKCTFSGFAKGSGMIHPNMATMLGFVVTDCAIAAECLQSMLSELTDETFNQITVDGDTSTNDAVVLLANGLAENPVVTLTKEEYPFVKELYRFLLTELAKMIARDGEGATKLIEATVNGAKTKNEAQIIAKAIVGSNLVKAAMFGNDPNWGRIISTIGATNCQFQPDKVTVKLNQIEVVKDGQPVPFSEQEVSNSLQQATVFIDVDLQTDSQVGKAWGCDLTYDYVKINATYST
ncbi:bifunctional glutamate N-acetyltransferase/amino-acid acetyltransferase ArgJ [Enterococcus camelliae]|uniref:Arginine biosynthesis bifunctional protein ArgJ n=1 Tax=Enterococcus camelliae TaxID=453959 RepID=A0ABW5TIV5_9ENTE